MSHSAGDSQGSVDPVQVSREDVILDREVEVREEGVVVTYRLTTDTEEAASATVMDVVPDSLPTADAGFHPDNEPYEWQLDDRDLTFQTVVPEEGERIVVFGIATPEPADDDVAFVDPELIDVEPVNPAVAEEDMDITLPDVDEPDRADAIAEVIQGGEAPDGGGEQPTGSGASSDEIEAALEGLSDEAGEADTADSPDQSTEEDEGESVIDLEQEPTAGADPPVSVPEEGLVAALIDELESGGVDESDRDALVEALGVAESTPDENSLDVRLTHVQSRMDDFAAYAEALEDIINEHGTADAFMTEIRDEVELVDQRVEDLHERLDDLETHLADLPAEPADRDDVEELEAAVSDLRSDVKDVQKVRETLLDAFADSEDA